MIACPARATAPAIKAVSLLTRPPGADREGYSRDWLARHAVAPVPGLKGLLYSESIGDAPFDAIVSAWFDDRDRAVAALEGIAGDGSSTDLVTREHVFVPGARRDGSIKRTLLIVRKPELSHAQFLAHWLSVHGDLARGVPGLAGCVLTELEPDRSAAIGIDGISESWWVGPGTETGQKVASPQADRWAKDGDNFIDGGRTRLILSREHLLVPLAS